SSDLRSRRSWMPWLLLNGVGIDDEGSWRPLLARTFPRPFRILAATEETTTVHRGRRMSGWSKARIQLCGRFVADIDGCRVEDALPGRRGRLVFAYLVLNRGRASPRDELLVVGWGEDTPAEAGEGPQCAVVQAAAQPGLRPPPRTDRDRVAAAAGDLRRRRGGPGGRPPGGVGDRPGTLGAGLGAGRDRLPRRHQAVPHRAGGPLDRPVAPPPGGGPAPRAGVLRPRRPRPRRPAPR